MKRLVTMLVTLCMICCFSAVALADEETISVTYRDRTYTGTLRECQEQARADFGGCACGYLYLESTGKLYNINIHEEERQYYLDGTGEDIDATPEPTAEPTMEPTPTPTSSPTPAPTPILQLTTQPTAQPTIQPTARPAATLPVKRETVAPTKKPVIEFVVASPSPTPKPCGCSISPMPTLIPTVTPAVTTQKATITAEPTASPDAEGLSAKIGDSSQVPCPCIIRQKITDFFRTIWTWFLNLIT